MSVVTRLTKLDRRVVGKQFRDVRNQLKKVIKETKKSFYYNALSSKRPKEVWSTIHRILHPNPRPIDANPEKLNNHFATVAERLTGREGKSHDDLIQIINDMPSLLVKNSSCEM